MDVKNRLNTLTSSQKYEYSSFNIFHHNIRGLKDKHDKMIYSFISFNINPHLICISEHYTNELLITLLYLIVDQKVKNMNLVAVFMYEENF